MLDLTKCVQQLYFQCHQRDEKHRIHWNLDITIWLVVNKQQSVTIVTSKLTQLMSLLLLKWSTGHQQFLPVHMVLCFVYSEPHPRPAAFIAHAKWSVLCRATVTSNVRLTQLYWTKLLVHTCLNIHHSAMLLVNAVNIWMKKEVLGQDQCIIQNIIIPSL